ncbi:S9 family peptidase [Chondromyces crocatus]|uniref:Peptidase S9 n=1 Tax=Chondromyces crocatus TaxID=52 RepID=A0A0K1EPU0_CHOCO|nr:S9 family peptidase [Chondromyces crocatus]AKT42945.1 peptidase S9 [Chondromyces crocatus]
MRTLRSLTTVLGFTLLTACGGAPTVEPSAAEPPPGTPVATTAPPAAAPMKAPRADAKLIPRSVLFGNPERAAPRVSHDGKHLAFLAPDQGVLNVWVAPIGDLAAAKVVTKDRKRGIRMFFWPYDSQYLAYQQDKDGDENFRVYAVDLKSGETKDITPYDGVRAQIVGLSDRIPGELLVALNDRDKRYHDIYRVNLKSGDRKLVYQNDQFAEIECDDDFKPRLAMKKNAAGGSEFFDLTGKEPKPFVTVAHEDDLTTGVLGYDRAGKILYFLDSRDRDTAALVTLDAKGKATVIAQDPKSDVQGVTRHPKTGKVQAVVSNRERRTWHVVDKAIQAELDALKAVTEGDFDIISRTLDDSKWTVAFTQSNGPVRYYLYDRVKKKADFLFTNQKALESIKLATMTPVVIKARDGLELVSYLSLPPDADPDADGKPTQTLPLVLLVHGGPWARDSWGLNPMHQWLTNRGYAVLSVNYRGSTGFGKKFVNAGDKEWAAKMHDDLLDAVKWAVDGKITTEKEVAIMGGSYGGYATLVGLTYTPDTFACGVDIVGPSNLVTLLESIPPYWVPIQEQFAKRVGDLRTPDGKELLLSRSPLLKADAIKKPLLIGQGANDPRVKQAESDQIVKAMQDKKLPVTYVLYPDEGHGFARPENRLSFNAVAETFLAQCLGGPYQPIGEDFKGSSIQVPEGASVVYGLSEALPKK